MSHKYLQRLKDRVLEGTEAETGIMRFYKWLITTTNFDFPSVNILNDDEKELKLITNERKLLLIKIAIQQVLGNDAAILLIEQLEL